MSNALLPPATIGILGGGQLGRMLTQAATAMGYHVLCLDPTPDSPCGQVAEQIVAPYDSLPAVTELALRSSLISYEFENVNVEVLAHLERQGATRLPQGSELLAITQHRLREKALLTELGLSVAPFWAIHCLADLQQAAEELGYPLLLKTCQGGYDGYGQIMLRQMEDLAPAFDRLSAGLLSAHPLPGLIAERCLALAGEISVIVARNDRGECETFPVAENIHYDNILRFSIVPARQPVALQQQAREWALRIAGHLQLVGLLAVEFFICDQGQLYVNEMAPRPHNSGHYSQDACSISQFSQHIRAICNLPLQPVQLLTPVVMVNILGAQQARALALMQSPDLFAREHQISPCYHWYGKENVTARRKMGHINPLVNECEQGLAWVRQSHLF